MDWSKEREQGVRYHIDMLVDLLRGKGYIGHFQVNGAPGESLKRGLERHFGQGNRRLAMQLPVNLKTYVYYKHPGESVECSFRLRYSSSKGFSFEALDIERRQAHRNTPIRRHMKVDGGWGIPTAERASEMARMGLSFKKRGL